MKVTCDREALLAAAQTAAAVAPTRSPKPILQNIKFEVSDGAAAILLATDLEVGIRIQKFLAFRSTWAGKLPCCRWAASARSMRESSDESLRLESDGGSTLVRGEWSELNFSPAENPQEFPAVADFNESAFHELSCRGCCES